MYLKDHIIKHFKKVGTELNLKYIDPSYTIRSMPASPYDSAFCLMLGHNAVHAAMAGRTNMVVGDWQRRVHTCAHCHGSRGSEKDRERGEALEYRNVLHGSTISDDIGRWSKLDLKFLPCL